MRIIGKTFAVLAAASCCAGVVHAQQRPSVLGSRHDQVMQVPEWGRHSPEAPRSTGTSSDDLIRKQTQAILELSEKVGRIEKRLTELEAKGRR